MEIILLYGMMHFMRENKCKKTKNQILVLPQCLKMYWLCKSVLTSKIKANNRLNGFYHEKKMC